MGPQNQNISITYSCYYATYSCKLTSKGSICPIEIKSWVID